MENHILDYSEGIPSTHRLVSKIVSFLNSNGGTFVIGVNDKTHKLTKKTFSQKDEERVVQVLISNIMPRPNFLVELTPSEKGDQIVIKVPEGYETPYYKKNKGIPDGVYIRIGSVTTLATAEDVPRLYMKRRNIGYDEHPITYLSNLKLATLGILNKSKLEGYVKKVSKEKGFPILELTAEHILDIKAGISQEGKTYPTVGGILLFCDDPNIHISELSECYIKGARFPGDKVGRHVIDQKIIKGPLDVQLQGAFAFVISHLNYGGVINGLKRKDVLEIPEFIIRELIVNAVTHRDYTISGATINIAIFDDRIEFNSPGGLPSGVTPQNIKDKSVIRNKVIADYLHNMKYIERFGLGWDRIIMSAKECGMPVPEIKNLGSAVKVIVKRKQVKQSKKTITHQKALSENERIILAHLEPKKKYALAELQGMLENSTEKGLKQILGKLKKKGHLRVDYSGLGNVELSK